MVGTALLARVLHRRKGQAAAPAGRRDQRGRGESVGTLLGMVAALYGVFLAFVVVAVWDNQTQARNNTYTEANTVARLYFTSRNTTGPQRTKLAYGVRDYARTLVDDEWPGMESGHDSAKAWDALVKLREQAQAYDTATGGQQNAANLILGDVEQLADSRRLRLDAMPGIVPSILWACLFLGAVLTVGFSLALEHSGTPLHTGMVVATTALLAFLLWLIWALDSPFSGVLRLGPDALNAVLYRIDRYPL
ncbi:hypothetical protein BG418_08315 [Streptomyces sp. CBMA152]|nr:hypothetical protein [Streptomyces sp. CBMA152]